MKKTVFLLLSLLLIISLPIFAEDMPADPMADTGAQADLSVQGDISLDAALPPGENPGAPAQVPQDMPNPAPENPAVQDPAGMDMSGMDQISGNNAAPQQAAPAINNTALKQEKVKAVPAEKQGLPKYKAVPYTNDLRIMDKKTGALGQVDTLKRYMDWAVEASSSMEKKNHRPMDTNDLNAYTAWVENKDGYGEGESLILYLDPIYFSAIQEGEVNAVKCTGLKIINGYNKSHEDWFNNSRVKIMKIYHNKKPFCLIELYDSTNWQDITFKKPIIIKPDDVIKAEVVEVFEGYKYPNAAITEFLLVGKPNGQIIGYDQLNGKSMANVRNGGMYFK